MTGRAVAAGLLAALASLGGCVFYAPTSAQTPHGLQDLRYGTGLARLLVPGVAREQVLTTLGTPDRVVDGGRILLYASPAQSGELWFVLVAPNGAMAAQATPLGRSVALAIVFDDRGGYVRHHLAVAGMSETFVAAQRALQQAASP